MRKKDFNIFFFEGRANRDCGRVGRIIIGHCNLMLDMPIKYTESYP